MKIKGPLLALGMTIEACAPGHSAHVPAASPSAPTKAPETKLGKASIDLPFSMLGASEQEVVLTTRNILQTLGRSYTTLGLQSDGTVIECEIAPKNSDMAMPLATVNARLTLNQPDSLLIAASSAELPSTGEKETCVQTKPNPNAKPSK
jgi:hypothetical protein